MNEKELVQMAHDIQMQISIDYDLTEKERVISMLSELTHKHVMAQSEWNLLSARRAILTLADGKIEKLPELVKAAQIDFRDVIYWVTLDRKNPKS